jgi:hypothetical protein
LYVPPMPFMFNSLLVSKQSGAGFFLQFNHHHEPVVFAVLYCMQGW